MSQLVEYLISFGPMVSPSWITNALVILCLLTPTNKFEMTFAPLLETNHHKQIIIFGAALLFNETIPSFIWLFETFVIAMEGNHPSTIFTDPDAAMAGAIAYVFPNTSHRLCLWHIYLNASKHLSHVIHDHPRSLNLILKDVSMKIDQRNVSKRSGMNC
jgi:hypothetical protein